MILETAVLTALGTQLKNLLIKHASDEVNTRLTLLRNEKNSEKLRAQYEEIIFDLLRDRSEALSVAQELQNELNRIQISDEDITSLHNTISNILDTLGKFSEDEDPEWISQVEAVKDLISADTLRSLQLLGFNYKQALGETLTELTQSWLKAALSPNRSNNTKAPVPIKGKK